jgi:hypothetical protein
MLLNLLRIAKSSKRQLNNSLSITILSLLLMSSCDNSNSSLNTTAEEVFTSSLSFSMDYADWQLEDKKTFADFEALFTVSPADGGKLKQNTIRLANIDILNGDKKNYDFNQGFGDIVITKESKSKYTILEYYIIPIGSVYGKVALLRYILDAKAGTVTRDHDFKPQLHVYKYWYNHIIKEYDQYLTDPTYTSKDWKLVPHAAYDVMRFLMFNLTLAAVEGCDECGKRMKNIKEDYSFVQSAEYGQNILVCEGILRKFLD